jgi:hypothetical protein
MYRLLAYFNPWDLPLVRKDFELRGRCRALSVLVMEIVDSYRYSRNSENMHLGREIPAQTE